MRFKVVLPLLLVLVSVLPVSAQAPSSYRMDIYPAGGPAPLPGSDAFLASAALCNQTKPTATSTVNPTRVIWDDKANAGKVCIYVTPPTAALRALPGGSYELVLVGINAAGQAEAARSPFSRLTAPSAETGVQVIQ